MPRYTILRTRTETMTSTTRATSVIDAPDARVALQLAERYSYSDGFEWEDRDDSTIDANYEDDYEVLEEMADEGEWVRGQPSDFGLAQDAMFGAPTTPAAPRPPARGDRAPAQ